MRETAMHLNDALSAIEDFYRRTYWQAPTAITQEGEQYTLTYSGVKWLHSINQLWMHYADSLDEPALNAAEHFFYPYHAEYSVVLVEFDPTGRINWLKQHGYFERASNPVLALRGLPRPRHMHRELRIVRALAAHQQDLLDVLYGAFFMGPEIGRCAVKPEHFGDPTIRHYIAYVGEEPAGCATVMLNGKIAGVWNVGTLRPFRRQGIASALMMKALTDAAADGYPESVLLASPMGKPLYEEMGFEQVGSAIFFGVG